MSTHHWKIPQHHMLRMIPSPVTFERSLVEANALPTTPATPPSRPPTPVATPSATTPPSTGGTVIVGAGPAALAVATMLRCHDLGPVEVIDPNGGWLTAWHHRFAAQSIAHLRSPSVHHPHPDPFALLATAGADDLVRSGQANLPTTDAFARFTADLVVAADLADAITASSVEAIDVLADGTGLLRIADGTLRRPDRVVLATNRRNPNLLPALDGREAAHPAVRQGDRCDVRRAPEGGHVVVIGGGLSAAHLCVGAASRGALVTLVARSRLRVRRYDTHPTWLGPRKLRPFRAEVDPVIRHRMLAAARGGGTMPHRNRVALQHLEDTGQLRLRERCELTGVDTAGDALLLCLDDREVMLADELWCATGGRIDVLTDPLLTQLRHHRPTAVAGGLPDLDDHLTWPGTNVHLIGAAAGLVLGPTAGNLIGHRRAAQRITAALRGLDPERADRITTGTGACPGLGSWPPTTRPRHGSAQASHGSARPRPAPAPERADLHARESS